MEKYIGVKIILAKPMTAEEAGTVLSRPIDTSNAVAEQSINDIVHPGYLVMYLDGYRSWSPKAQFEGAYRPTSGMTFGWALEAAKKGIKITRPGWNGRGMFVVYQKGYPQGIPSNKQTAEAWGMNEGDLFICQPYLQIKNVDGSHSMWVPSINDCLADDWMVVD